MSGLMNKHDCAQRQRPILTLLALIPLVQLGCGTAGMAPAPTSPAPEGEHADIWNAVPQQPVAKPAEARRILVFSRSEGFLHEAIGATEVALEYMGEKTGAFEITVSTDMQAFEASNLARFDAVLFNNTTQLAFEDPDHRRALLEFVRGGKGVIGIHAATDNFYDWPEAAAMMGGLFDGHPWGADGTWAVKIDEPDHPLNRSFERKAFLISDEIYQITGPYSRDTHRVLLSLDMSNLRNRQVEGIKRDDDDFAISWIKPFGAGRVFYCSLGHNLEVLRNEAVLAHYLAGIQYALGDLEADDTPSNALVGPPQPALTTDAGAVEDPFAMIIREDFGSSRLSQATIEDVIRNTAPADYGAIEDRLIEILDNPASTYAAKQFVCRMLRRIGSDHSLPHLARMLLDEELTDDARIALQGHASPEVDRILRESLDQLSGPALVGVIGSIGQRRDRDAVPHLVDLVDPADTTLTVTIVAALGEIGGAQARDALTVLELPSGLEPLRQDALLRCADDLASAGAHAEARDMYRQMTTDAYPVPVRIAAWRGLVRSQQAESGPSLLAMLRSDEPEIQRAGARFIIEMHDIANLLPVAEQLPSFPESARILAISALASAGFSRATPTVIGLIESDTGAVRNAAIRALGELGDSSDVQLLAAIAVEREDSVAARESLVRLSGVGVDDRIIATASGYQGPARAALIDVLASRNAVAAGPTFLTYAEDRDATVRRVSIGALSRLAEDSRLPDLIALLERSDDREDRLALEEAIVAVCERMVDRDSGLDRLIEALDRGSEANRIAFLRILGRLPDQRSLAALYQATGDRSAGVREVAIESLGDWTDTNPLDTLLGLAASATAEGERAAAITSVLNLMNLPHERTSTEDERLFQSLFDLAGSTDEKELVLDGLAGRSDFWTLGMVEPLLADPTLGGKARAIQSDLVEAVARTVSHDAVGRPVTLASPFASQYDGGGPNALTDGSWGSTDPGDGSWQGFEGVDLDAIIDLGRVTEIRSVRAGFLEAHGSWIFLPREVTFSIAGEDRVFETVATYTLPVPGEQQPAATRSVSTELSGKTARYVRVVAVNVDTLPAWHHGAGGQAWLFADEIQINAHLDNVEVGFGKADVTPDLARHAVWMAGYGNNRRATGVHDTLWARAVVLREGASKLALVSVDLIGLQRPAVLEVRARLPGYLHVLVASTHNHEGPDVIGLWGPSQLQSGVDTAYVAFVVERIVAAVKAAEATLTPALAAYGTAAAPELLLDSRLPLLEDPILRAVQFTAHDGRPLGFLLQFSNHPESLGPDNTLVTADFPHYTINELEARYGVPVAYFTGAIGGLMTNPAEFTTPGGATVEAGTFEFAEAYGAAVARVFDQAIAAVEPLELSPLVASAAPVFVPLANPGYRQGRAIGVLTREAFAWIGNADSSGGSLPAQQVDGDIAIETEVAYVRAGDLHIAGIPGELYPELVYGEYQSPAEPNADFPDAATEPPVMATLPGEKTMIFGLANDEVGYIIPKRQWDDVAPFAYGRDEKQYGEVNSVGPEVAPILMQALQQRVRHASLP